MTTTRAVEPCAICGEETTVGSPFYSDRRVVDHRSGTRSFICSSCLAEAQAKRGRRQFTDEETARYIENARLAGMVGDH